MQKNKKNGKYRTSSYFNERRNKHRGYHKESQILQNGTALTPHQVIKIRDEREIKLHYY